MDLLTKSEKLVGVSADEILRLDQETRELKCANQILKLAASSSGLSLTANTRCGRFFRRK